MKFKFTLLLFCFSLSIFSQNLYPSRVKIETEIADSTWYAASSAGVVQVNDASGEIAFKVGIKTITTDVFSLDSALGQMENQFVFFKGNFPVKNLSFTDADNESSQDYSGKAFLTIGGITKEVDYSCEVYNFNHDDEFAVGNNVYPLRIGLFFDFQPLDFKLNSMYKPLTKTIKVEISNGFINKINNGGDTIFPK
ncbi:MAG: hypothetical protein ABI448_15165 [Bacteroidia bacterium]